MNSSFLEICVAPSSIEHLAEETVLEQYKMLVLGVQLVEHLVDFEGHAETEIVEQRLYAIWQRRLDRFFGWTFDRFFHRCTPRDSLPADGGPSCAINANSASEHAKSSFLQKQKAGTNPGRLLFELWSEQALSQASCEVSCKVSCPRRISLTSTRFAANASRSTGIQLSGSAEPHMNMSNAA